MKCLFILALFTLTNASVYYDLDSEYESYRKGRNFTGKVALVTGSNSGIGEGVVRMFSALGARVVITGRNATTIREVAEEVQLLSPYGYKPLKFAGDLTKDSDVEKLVNATIKKFGRLDILVNKAGAGFLTSVEGPNFIETFEKTHALNLRAPALLNHLAVPHLKKTNGTIIHTSSIASILPSGPLMPYSMAKIGIDMMTRCLALELGPHGVRVNAINPGYIKTNFQGQGFPDAIIKRSIALTPLRRGGEPIDIARGVAFLASSDAAFITGANLVIDGGLVYTAGGLMSP